MSSIVQQVAPVDLESQVTYQAYNPSSLTGTVTFETALQWPFELESGSVASLPAGISLLDLQDVTPAGSCDSVDGSVCLQTFTFHVTPTNSCQLTGDYVVNFQVTCRGSAQCPITASDSAAALTFSITSTDFCAVVGTEASVNATLASYSDSALQSPLASFVVGQTGYFKISVFSAQIPLSHVQLGSVVVSQGAASATLSNTEIAQVENSVSSASFALFFNSSLFTVPSDGSLTYGITVTVDLTFADSRKRTVTSTQSLQSFSSAQTQVQLYAPGSSPSKDTGSKGSQSRNTVIGAAVGGAVGLAAVGGLALLSAKYWKARKLAPVHSTAL